MDEGRGGTYVDATAVALLAVATLLYSVRLWPHDLFLSDEGTFLYEAKRIVDGDVPYRDFFDIITPGGLYFIALSFRLLGVSMETARLAHAAIHATIVVLIYVTCRSTGVRRAFAVTACMAHVALAYPALPFTSPHWMGTLLTLAVLCAAVRRRIHQTTRWAFQLGLVCGALVAVEHQKAAFVIVAAMLAVALDFWLIKRYGAQPSAASGLAAFVAGLLLIIAPPFAMLFAAAGIGPVYESLLLHPLVQYQPYHHATWGAASWLHPELYVRPDLMQRWPWIVPVMLVQFLIQVARRADYERTRQSMVLALIGAAAVAAVWYYPDYIHLGTIAPVLFVLIAAWAETACALFEGWLRLPRLIGSVAAALLWWPLAVQANTNQLIRHQLYPLSHQTAFGQVDFKYELEADLVDAVRQLYEQTPGIDALYCYPACSAIYLTTGTRNPTRFQLMLAGYNTPAQFDEVIEALERNQVPYVVLIATTHIKTMDPTPSYLARRFERIRFSSGPTIVHHLFRRRPEKVRTIF